MRLSATKALLERADSLIVATVSAIYGLGDPSSFLKMSLRLAVGERMEQREVLRRLAEMQYSRNDFERSEERRVGKEGHWLRARDREEEQQITTETRKGGH